MHLYLVCGDIYLVGVDIYLIYILIVVMNRQISLICLLYHDKPGYEHQDVLCVILIGQPLDSLDSQVKVQNINLEI